MFARAKFGARQAQSPLALATSPENAPVLSGPLALAPRIPAHLTAAVQVA
jgi:hypothetical protein